MSSSGIRPFDPRLARYASATRGFIVAAVAVGIATTILIIVQAFAITGIVVPVFTRGEDLGQVRAAVLLLAAVIVVRVLLSFVSEWVAFRASADAKSQLRLGVTEKILDLGPVWLSGRNSAELTQLITRGVDGLDAYFSRYLPQLVLAVMVPLGVGVVILTQDLLAAVIVVLTVPLIPVFMILIGMYTQKKVDRQWESLARLSGHFVDVVVGMTTLKAFGRGRAQAKRVQAIGDEYRKTTMGVLRISFLSSLVLEVLAMLSVALIAVSIGLRLVDGSMTLEAGLLVLILAPEVYLPLRLVGMHFHAAAEGLGAAAQMIEVLEQESPRSGERTDVPDLSRATISFEDVSVRYSGRDDPALLDFNLQIVPSSVTALVGLSGAGKSTALAILERFLDVDSGRVIITGQDGSAGDLADYEIDAWRANVAWVGQDPQLVTGSLADNVRLARPSATDDQVWAALESVDMAEFVRSLPTGLATPVGETGRVFSAGQGRRIALARAFCQNSAGLVLLDEPTAA
ncbi:MAG: thiol reductant ABC exporter subunit CydD, partial [Actinobacteria bacterium]|nr:thiol reductant ABC exporter subunit CydD [Actinomycetota bacterium]